MVAAARKDYLSYVSIPLFPISPCQSSVMHYISKGSYVCIEGPGTEDVMEFIPAQVMECLVDRKTDEFFFKVRKFARLNELPPRKTAQYDWPSGFKPREHVLLEEDFLIQEVEVISTKEEVVGESKRRTLTSSLICSTV